MYEVPRSKVSDLLCQILLHPNAFLFQMAFYCLFIVTSAYSKSSNSLGFNPIL